MLPILEGRCSQTTRSCVYGSKYNRKNSSDLVKICTTSKLWSGHKSKMGNNQVSSIWQPPQSELVKRLVERNEVWSTV